MTTLLCPVCRVEDSPNGIIAARAASIFCVVVPNPLTSQLPIDHADLRLTSLADTSLQSLISSVVEKASARRGVRRWFAEQLG